MLNIMRLAALSILSTIAIALFGCGGGVTPTDRFAGTRVGSFLSDSKSFNPFAYLGNLTLTISSGAVTGQMKYVYYQIDGIKAVQATASVPVNGTVDSAGNTMLTAKTPADAGGLVQGFSGTVSLSGKLRFDSEGRLVITLTSVGLQDYKSQVTPAPLSQVSITATLGTAAGPLVYAGTYTGVDNYNSNAHLSGFPPPGSSTFPVALTISPDGTVTGIENTQTLTGTIDNLGVVTGLFPNLNAPGLSKPDIAYAGFDSSGNLHIYEDATGEIASFILTKF